MLEQILDRQLTAEEKKEIDIKYTSKKVVIFMKLLLIFLSSLIQILQA